MWVAKSIKSLSNCQSVQISRGPSVGISGYSNCISVGIQLGPIVRRRIQTRLFFSFSALNHSPLASKTLPQHGPLMKLWSQTEKQGNKPPGLKKSWSSIFPASAPTRVKKTDRNRSGYRGNRSNRSRPVPIWVGFKPTQI